MGIALLFAFLIHDVEQHWKTFEGWGREVRIDFKAMLKGNLKLNLEELNAKQQKRKKGWAKEQEMLEKKIHALYFDLPVFLGIVDWKKKKALLQVLTDEKLGKKACRLIGVKLTKDADYIPDQILQKLKGRKSELDLLFPDFTLPESEAKFLQAFSALKNKSAIELLPDELKLGSGTPFEFIRKCFDHALEKGDNLALAEFITASVTENNVTLSILHRQTLTVIKKVIKQESLEGYYKFDKDARTYSFLKVE